MRFLLLILFVNISQDLLSQYLEPVTLLTSNIENSSRLIVNEYGVYSFTSLGSKTIIYHSYVSDTVNERVVVDTISYDTEKLGVELSTDRLSGLFSSRKPYPEDSISLQLESLTYFSFTDTFAIQLVDIELEFIDTTLAIQWYLSAFSNESCMAIPLNATLNFDRINLVDSVQLFRINSSLPQAVPIPEQLSFGPLMLVDSFFYAFGHLDNHTKLDIKTGQIIETAFLDKVGETRVGGEPTVIHHDDHFIISASITKDDIVRNGRSQVVERIRKIDLNLEEIETTILYDREEIFNDLLSDYISGAYRNLFSNDDGIVFHSTYAQKDSLLLTTVLNTDFSTRSSFTFKLSTEFFIDQLFPDESDSVLYVVGYELVDVFRQTFDTIPLVYAIDYSLGGVSSGTLLPVTTSTSMRVYPNPASSWITVQCKSCEQDVSDLQTAIIFSSTGKIVSESRVESGRVDVSLLQPGTYQMLFLKENGHPVGASTLIKN